MLCIVTLHNDELEVKWAVVAPSMVRDLDKSAMERPSADICLVNTALVSRVHILATFQPWYKHYH